MMLLGVVFVVLKLCGVLLLSWWWLPVVLLIGAVLEAAEA